jgi:hypothetical protein
MKKEPVYWTMRDGKQIDIDEMSVQHLRNTLKMIVRNSQKRKKTVEFKLNGDIAQDFNSSWDDYESWMDSMDQASL